MMYKNSDTMNSIFSRIFFPVFIYVCAFFSLNLIVAVIVDVLLKSRQHNITEPGHAEAISNDPNASENTSGFNRGLTRAIPKQNEHPEAEHSVDQGSVTANRANNKTLSPLGCKAADNAVIEANPGSIHSESEVVEIKTSNRCLLNTAVVIVIIVNIIVMCFDRLDITDYETRILDGFDTFFFAFFMFEMLAKIYLEGFDRYFNSTGNITDAVINLCGIIEVSLTYSSSSLDYGTRGAIVILRVTRVIKLINKWSMLQDTLTFVWSTIGDIMNFLILLGLFVLMYAIIGMELFADKAKFGAHELVDLEHGESMRYNFDCLRNALIASYTLVIGESWPELYYAYSRVNHSIVTAYFFTGIYILNIFLVNVFIAIILQNFYIDENKKLAEEEERKNKEFIRKAAKHAKISPSKEYKDSERTLLTALKIFGTVVTLNKMLKEKKKKPTQILAGHSFFLISDDNRFRWASYHIVNSDAFLYLGYICTIASSIVITFRTPLYDPEGTVISAITIIDIVLAVFFCLEILLKSVCYGFAFNGEDSYLLNAWNVLDVLSTMALILQLALEDPYRGVEQIIMLFRMLRILRMVTIKEGFNLSIQAIVKGFPSIAQILGVGCLFFFILSVIGIHFFKGRLFHCGMGNIAGGGEGERRLLSEEGGSEPNAVIAEGGGMEIHNIYDCMNYGGDWKNADVSFDNMAISMMTLFELMTAKAWWALVIGLSDNNGLDKEPTEYSNSGTAWFVVLCTVVGFLFIRAIITGLINFAFCKQKEELQGIANLSYSQRKWANFSRVMFKASPVKIVRCLLDLDEK